MKSAKARNHVREHGSLLAAGEKRALVWMAERLPSWVTPDHLSLLGLSAMLAAGLAYWASHWNNLSLLGVVAALAVNWFGDSLDGTLARVRDQHRPRYGFYVDHVIDAVGTSFLLLGMALSDYMSLTVALGLLVAYLMVAAESYLATHTLGIFRLSFLKVGPTEMRILLAIGTLYLLHSPWVSIAGNMYLLFDIGGVVATVGLLGAFAVSAVRNSRTLYRAEPIPRRQKTEMQYRDVTAARRTPRPQPVPVARRRASTRLAAAKTPARRRFFTGEHYVLLNGMMGHP